MKKLFINLGAHFLMILVFASALRAEVKLASIFGDNMVLQQQADVAVWGKARANATVNIITSWNNRTYSTRADGEGVWKVKVATPAAGGPYTVTINDGKPVTLRNIMIGEVWVCSGQSNMEMPMKGFMNQPVSGSNEFIAAASNNLIRLITVPRATSLTPVEDFDGEWKLCEPENVSEFSATAYFFGLMLSKTLKVPVGLICTSWGGTRIEPWISETGFSKFDWVKLPDKTQPQEKLSQQTPTVLFNAMINPLVGYGIRGAIWYQGEANRNEPGRYRQLIPGLVENWRTVWDIGEFPFYYVQIAPYDYGPGGINSALLREAQLKASTSLPGIGMACIMDTGEKDNIHPADKKTAGDRLAYLALVKTYGKTGFACEGPVLKEMTIEGNQVRLAFDNAVNGLTSFGKELSCFEVAGSNRRFYPAVAFITGPGVTLFSPSVNAPSSAAQQDPETGEWSLKMGNVFFRDSSDDPATEYITWDAQLEANFRQIEVLLNQLYVISEMGATLLGGEDKGNSNMSGRALKFKMISPLAKAKRMTMQLDPVIKNVIKLVSQLGGNDIKDLTNEKITIKWQDGLPNDKLEEAEIIEKRKNSGTISTKTVLMEYDQMSEDRAEEEIEAITEEESMLTPTMEMGIEDSVGVEEGEE